MYCFRILGLLTAISLNSFCMYGMNTKMTTVPTVYKKLILAIKEQNYDKVVHALGDCDKSSLYIDYNKALHHIIVHTQTPDILNYFLQKNVADVNALHKNQSVMVRAIKYKKPLLLDILLKNKKIEITVNSLFWECLFTAPDKNPRFVDTFKIVDTLVKYKIISYHQVLQKMGSNKNNSSTLLFYLLWRLNTQVRDFGNLFGNKVDDETTKTGKAIYGLYFDAKQCGYKKIVRLLLRYYTFLRIFNENVSHTIMSFINHGFSALEFKHIKYASRIEAYWTGEMVGYLDYNDENKEDYGIDHIFVNKDLRELKVGKNLFNQLGDFARKNNVKTLSWKVVPYEDGRRITEEEIKKRLPGLIEVYKAWNGIVISISKNGLCADMIYFIKK